MDIRKLEEVAEVADGKRVVVHGTQRILRKGPFRLYIEEGAIPFDDYDYEGPGLILGAVCDVVADDGNLKVQQAAGRFSVTDTHHVVIPKEPGEIDYIRRVLEATPVTSCADISPQTVRLSERNLRSIHIPWPEGGRRRAFCSLLDDLETRLASLHGDIRDAYDCGLRAYRETAASCDAAQRRVGDIAQVRFGTALPGEKRSAKGPVKVVSSQGFAGRTGEPGVQGPCIVIGQAGEHVLSYYEEEDVYPLADTVALMAGADCLPLLYFALYDRGLRPSLRVTDDRVDAMKMTIDDIGDLQVRLGTDGGWRDCASRCAESLRSIASAREAIGDVQEGRRDLVSRFMSGDDAVLPMLPAEAEGCPNPGRTATAPAPANPCSPTASDLLPFQEMVMDVLGDLRASGRAEGLSLNHFDAVWEVLPLLVLRKRRDDSEWEGLLAARDAGAVIDPWLEQEARSESSLSFLGELTRSNSCLSDNGLDGLLGKLSGVPRDRITGSVVRGLYRENRVEEVRKGDVAAEVRVDAPVPRSVSTLMKSLAASAIARPASTYDPFAAAGELLPETGAWFAQTPQPADALAAILAADVDGRPLEADRLAVGDTLNGDAFPDRKADLVLSLLPANEGIWTDDGPDPDDGRWAFGAPPRNKANLAWLQHAYSHRADGGFAVLALCDSVLHESRGCEPGLRRNLIESGCVYCVVSLPPKLFDDGRPPMCILVLGDSREDDAGTLLIDAITRGLPAGDGTRFLPDAIAGRIEEAFGKWMGDGTAAAESGFCRVVKKSELIAAGDLTPWSFV